MSHPVAPVVPIAATASRLVRDPERDVRTEHMLNAPIAPLLIRMALPNILIMLAQASTGLVETFWVSRLGTDALAGMALVFPAVMLMTTISAGALGGSISSAVARALGSGRGHDANAFVIHAVAVNLLFGIGFSALFLLLGEPIYRLLGGTGGVLQAALVYSNVVFIGNGFVWVMNGLASVIRGTGNMRYPAIVTCAGVLFLIPVSPLLIFGVGPVPGLALPEGALRSSPIMLRAPSQWPGTSWPVARRCAFTGPISAGDSSPAFCGLGLFPRSIPS